MPLSEELKAILLGLGTEEISEALSLLSKSEITVEKESSSDQASSLGSQTNSENIQNLSTHEDTILTASLIDEQSSRPISPAEEARAASHVDASPGKSSVMTTVGGASFNSRVLLTIDPTKLDGQISISFTTERSDTSAGRKQEDHVIAERLVIEFVARSVLGKTLADAPRALLENFSHICKNDEAALATFKQIEPVILEKADTTDIAEDKQATYKLGVRFRNAQKVTSYITQMIECYNKLPLSIIPKDGHALPSEGATVATGMNILRTMNEVLSYQQTTEAPKQEIVDAFINVL